MSTRKRLARRPTLLGPLMLRPTIRGAAIGAWLWVAVLGAAALAQGSGGAGGSGTESPVAPGPRAADTVAPDSAGWERRTMASVDGMRSVLVFAPPAVDPAPAATAPPAAAQPPALLLVLHGNGGTGADMAAIARFHELAEHERFVVAYPDGLGGGWNYVRGIPGYPAAPDDTAFLTDLAADLEDAYGTDPARRYVVGYSNGGFMAQRLACDAPDAFAAFVAVGAGGFAGLDGVCSPATPVSIAFVHGTADTNVPWGGLPVPVPGGVVELTWPLPETFAWWAERAACDPPATRTELAGNPAAGVDAVIVFTLEACADRRMVALFGLRGGGHGWPSGTGFDASVAAWAFVRGQTLR